MRNFLKLNHVTFNVFVKKKFVVLYIWHLFDLADELNTLSCLFNGKTVQNKKIQWLG